MLTVEIARLLPSSDSAPCSAGSTTAVSFFLPGGKLVLVAVTVALAPGARVIGCDVA